jgi:hypothetical protein
LSVVIVVSATGGAALLFAAPATAKPIRPPSKNRTEAAKPGQAIAQAFGWVVGRSVLVAGPDAVRCPPGTKAPGPQCTPVPTGSFEQNAVEVAPTAGSPAGTYCFRAKGIAPGRKAVVLTSVTDVPVSTPPAGQAYRGLKGTPYAAWEPGAANCGSGQFEIQTAETVAAPQGLSVTPSGYVSFSFLIVGSS